MESERSGRSSIPILIATLLYPLAALAQGGPCDLLAPPDPSADAPDDGYVDRNDDGIDGMRCGPIFVAPGGSDANLGTIEAPMKTIGPQRIPSMPSSLRST